IVIRRAFISATCFRPVHIGQYIRGLHFRRQCQRLPLRQFRRILDAGCGDGSYALRMTRLCPWAKIEAMDLTLPTFTADTPSNMSVNEGDLRQLKNEEQYDFIYCIDVLEHIRDNQQILRNFHQALGREGYLFLHMPSDTLDQRIFPDRFFRHFDNWADHEHVGEQYSLPELTLLLTQTGFSICHAQYTFGRLGSLAWELDRLTDKHWRTKIMLMPILKLLARLSVPTRPRRGSLLVVAQK
ncbi:MAG: class I SAM-dependent methyltransferase, partial [Planctomycetes bacterium]|nr:class I SAM-dependent methyltransferase [Planctomycetota bacterium]